MVKYNVQVRTFIGGSGLVLVWWNSVLLHRKKPKVTETRGGGQMSHRVIISMGDLWSYDEAL